MSKGRNVKGISKGRDVKGRGCQIQNKGMTKGRDVEPKGYQNKGMSKERDGKTRGCRRKGMSTQRVAKAKGCQNSGPVVRQDAPEMLPSDVMFYFLWFWRCFLCFFFSSACVMSFHFCFFEFRAKFAWHHSFAHVARGYSEMHLFKCWWWLRYSEMAIFTHIIYFF